MDKQLSETFAQLSQQSGVVGFCCSDESGLCLKSQGSNQSANAGFYKSIVDKSKLLSQSGETPNIVIESDNVNIFVQQNDKITLAVLKTN